jgi:hypothetical protein
MKQLYTILIFLLIACPAFAVSPVWSPVASKTIDGKTPDILPSEYLVFRLNVPVLKAQLAALPETPEEAMEISLPSPDGEMLKFKIWNTPILPAELQAKYPQISTYSARLISDENITAKIDFTAYGFHAAIFNGNSTYYIDPFSSSNSNYYICYYKSNYQRVTDVASRSCEIAEGIQADPLPNKIQVGNTGLPKMQLKTNGTIKRTYRLALACTAEYATAVAGSNLTKANVLSAMVTSMNRVNGVYEKELAVTMQFVPNNDALIYLTNPDPYSNGSGSTMQGENQSNIDAIIGSANYDIGHVFSTGGGGIADLACICIPGTKARGVTGQRTPVGDPFDIDFVAHEMGHQFGANHTFNANKGSCFGNGEEAAAYEPGGGTTLMAYAGICSDNNIQAASSDYFHAYSLHEITTVLSTSGSCAAITTSNNIPPVVPQYTATYYIPFLTPFELTAPEAVDADHDLLTYNWEQFDLGDFMKDFSATKEKGPIFRSFPPTTSRTRVFPTIEKLIANSTSYLGEKLPEVERDLTFRLTVRDVNNGIGTFNFPEDSIKLKVVNTGIPFSITQPNAKGWYWQVNTNVTVTWEVAKTDLSPISCSNVDIMLSLDNGRTYPFVLAENTPNDGNEVVLVPNQITDSARVKVKGRDNVFFDISNQGFMINTWPTSTKDVFNPGEYMSVYPVPSANSVNIAMRTKGQYSISIVNVVGQKVWDGKIEKSIKLPVNSWAKGIYFVNAINESGDKQTKKLVVQ